MAALTMYTLGFLAEKMWFPHKYRKKFKNRCFADYSRLQYFSNPMWNSKVLAACLVKLFTAVINSLQLLAIMCASLSITFALV
jgi:hypothetical protein